MAMVLLVSALLLLLLRLCHRTSWRAKEILLCGVGVGDLCVEGGFLGLHGRNSLCETGFPFVQRGLLDGKRRFEYREAIFDTLFLLWLRRLWRCLTLALHTVRV